MKYLTTSLIAWLLLILSLNVLAQPNWTAQFSGLPAGLSTKQLYFVGIDENNCWATLVNVDNSHGRFIRTTDGGTTWNSSIITGATNLLACNMTATDANNAWIVFDSTSGSNTSSGVFRTTDGGTSWTKQIAATDPRFIYFFDNLNGVVIGNPQGGYWAIYTTSNGGNTWNRVPSANIPLPIAGETIYPGGAPCGLGNNFWFATINSNGSLFKTTDKGYSWSVNRNACPGTFGMAVAFEDSLTGLLCGDGPDMIRLTTDGGETFTDRGQISGITPGPISFVPGTKGIYVMTNFDLFGWLPGSAYTLDTGKTWITIDYLNHGRSDFVSPNYGWSGGGNDSLYKWSGTVLPVEQENNSSRLKGFTLIQNYPNPFNPSTTFRYSIPTQSKVKIKVYDILGNEIATLINEEKPAGEYEVEFDASSLPSGVYFYQLKAGDFASTKKMILLK